MSRLAGAFVAVLLVLLSGCSGGPDPAPTPEPTAEPTAESTSSSTTSPTPSARPAAECLDGEYTLDRFVAVNNQASFGTGEGGDVRVRFADGTYTLSGAGKEPITLTLAGQQGKLLVDGSVQGTYDVVANKATFKVGKASGSATVELAGQQRTLTMNEIGNVLAPEGEAALACNDEGLVILLSEVRLELSPA